MRGLEVPLLLGVDSLSKSTLLEPLIQKEHSSSFTLFLNEKLKKKNTLLKLKMFSNS